MRAVIHSSAQLLVMAGLVPAIHDFLA